MLEGAEFDAVVGVVALEPPEPAGDVDTPVPGVAVVVDDGGALIGVLVEDEVDVGADDDVVVLVPAPALAVSAGALLTG